MLKPCSVKSGKASYEIGPYTAAFDFDNVLNESIIAVSCMRLIKVSLIGPLKVRIGNVLL